VVLVLRETTPDDLPILIRRTVVVDDVVVGSSDDHLIPGPSRGGDTRSSKP